MQVHIPKRQQAAERAFSDSLVVGYLMSPPSTAVAAQKEVFDPPLVVLCPKTLEQRSLLFTGIPYSMSIAVSPVQLEITIPVVGLSC